MGERIIGFAIIDMTSDPTFPRGHVVVRRALAGSYWDVALTEAAPIQAVPAIVQMALELESHGA